MRTTQEFVESGLAVCSLHSSPHAASHVKMAWTSKSTPAVSLDMRSPYYCSQKSLIQ